MYRNRKTTDYANYVTPNGGHGPDAHSRHEASAELDPGATEEFKDYTNTDIYRQLRPLLVCMRIFGLFFKRSMHRKGKPFMEIVVLYCFVVNFLMVFNVLRSFTVYRMADEFDNVLVQRLLFTIWSTECTFKGLLLMWNCYQQTGLPKFFCEWDKTCGEVNLDKMCLFMMKKYIALSFIFIAFNSVVFSLVLNYVPVLKAIYFEVIWKNAVDYEKDYIFKIVLGILSVLNSSSSMFPLSLFVVLSCAIGKELNRFTDDLTTAIEEDDFHGRIEDFRLRHQYLCLLVDILDRIFSPMIAAVFIANIPMFCLVLYTMVTTLDIHISLVLINLFWLCFILLQMTIVSITAAWVNVKAHSPLDHIYSIRFSKTSNDVQLQMLLFLNRLTGTQIGLTAMKLFVIDKPTILTVAGMMITYFVLLIQFKMPKVTDCQCNVTGGPAQIGLLVILLHKSGFSVAMATVCSDDVGKQLVLSVVFMSLGGAMFIVTITIWISLMCRERRRRQKACRNKHLKSQITMTGHQGGTSRRIWRTQSFFRESATLQPVRIPRPVLSGHQRLSYHATDSQTFRSCAKNNYYCHTTSGEPDQSTISANTPRYCGNEAYKYFSSFEDSLTLSKF